MRLEQVEQKVKDMQELHKNLTKLEPVGKKYEPGETGFIPKKGMLLLNGILIMPRERAIKLEETQLTTSDFHGLHPYIGLVMESSSDQFKIGEVVLLSQGVRTQDVVINGTVGAIVYESDILGIDVNF
jgi:hypothetical protein